jgi:hypothetical protein
MTELLTRAAVMIRVIMNPETHNRADHGFKVMIGGEATG